MSVVQLNYPNKEVNKLYKLKETSVVNGSMKRQICGSLA